MASNNNRSINLEHSNEMVGAYIQEHWIIKDPVYDGSKVYGFDLPAGTWFVVMKIEDKAFWAEHVKQLNKVGFSIEGILGQKLMYMAQETTYEEVIDTLTEEEIEYIFAGQYRFGDQGEYQNSTPPCHPNCKCEIVGNTWIVHKVGEYPCEICVNNRKKWLRENANKPGSQKFNME
jgi:hypothetical protein